MEAAGANAAVSNHAINLTGATLAGEAVASQVVLQVVEPTEARFRLANGRADGDAREVMEACNQVRITHLRQGEVVQQERITSLESRGRAAMVAPGGSPIVVERAEAEEDFLLTVDYIYSDSWAGLRPGDLLVLEASAYATIDGLYSPAVEVEGAPGAFRAVLQHQPGFTCAANLERFEGTFVTSGVVPAALGVVDAARWTVPDPAATRAHLLMGLRAGACRAGIGAGGEVVADSGVLAGPCAVDLEHAGDQGQLAFWIASTAGLAPWVGAFAWNDRPGNL